MLYRQIRRKSSVMITIKLIIFSVTSVKKIKNNNIMQYKRESYKYQNVGKVLMFQNLNIHRFSRHAVILATQ